MAMAKLTALVLLMVLMAAFGLSVTEAVSTQYQLDAGKRRRFYGEGSLKPSQCNKQCGRRCKNIKGKSKIGRHNACMEFCTKCCKKCLCVPPGYSGNKAVCPCYNNWKTKRGGPKCP